jgi:hypothetical protein
MALKLGTENRKQVYLAAGLGVLVVAALIYFIVNVFGGPSAPPAPVATQAPPPPPATGSTHEAPKVARATNLDPTLHFELLTQTESLLYTGKGRNIFSQASAQLAAVAAAAPARPEPTGPPPPPPGPPPPPPVDLKFYGFTSQQGGKKQVFLLHGDDVFIASEGDVVDHRYKVAKIAPFSVQITDIPYNNTQTLALIAEAPTSRTGPGR